MWWNGTSRCEFDGKSKKTETTTWSEFPNGGKAIVEQMLASEEINKFKRAVLGEPQSGIRVGKLTLLLEQGTRSNKKWPEVTSSRD